MSIGKSVPNLISYLHEFFHNFSQFPAIYFELISLGVIFNSEITDKLTPPVSRRAPLPRGRHAPRRHSGLKPLSGQRARASRQHCLAFVAPLPTAPPALDSAAPPDCRLARTAVVLTARALTAAVRSRVA
jgi:hypothetical protein